MLHVPTLIKGIVKDTLKKIIFFKFIFGISLEQLQENG